ncbi:MAG: MOSC domain-containing protein [Actinomycetales bacterium]
MSRVIAVCRVHELRADAGQVGVTAIDKRPVEGPVKVRRLGLYGDVQADREHHGGLEQAVYAYAEESVAEWARELGRVLPPGIFGENLRTEGLDVDGAELGERWRIGTVEFEVSGPRVPCATFARRMGEPSWVRRFTDRGKVGAYLRVRSTGELRAGDAVEVLSRPGHGVSVSQWFMHQRPEDAQALRDSEREGGLTIGPSLAAYVDRALARAH